MDDFCIECKVQGVQGIGVSYDEVMGRIKWGQCALSECQGSRSSVLLALRVVSVESRGLRRTLRVKIRTEEHFQETLIDFMRSSGKSSEEDSSHSSCLHSNGKCNGRGDFDMEMNEPPMFLQMEQHQTDLDVFPLMELVPLDPERSIVLEMNGNWVSLLVILYRDRVGQLYKEAISCLNGTLFFDTVVEEKDFNVLQVPFDIEVGQSDVSVDVKVVEFTNCDILVPSNKEFTISNPSDMKTVCKLSIDCDNRLGTCFDFMDCLSGVFLTKCKDGYLLPVHPEGDTKVRIVFTLHPSCLSFIGRDETLVSLLIQNTCNLSNGITIPVRIHPPASTEELRVKVEPSVVDFGECYTSVVQGQTIRLYNSQKDTLVIGLSSDCPFVWFSLQLRDDDGQIKVSHISRKEEKKLGNSVGSFESNDAYSEALSPLVDTPRTLFAPLSSDRKTAQDRVDEVTIPPGHERIVHIWLKHESLEIPDSMQSRHLGQLRLTPLQVFLVQKLSQSSLMKTIHCKAQICTSLIHLEKDMVNLGDCPVGITRRDFIKVHNTSDLSTIIELQFRSTNLSIGSKKVSIEPHAFVSIPISYHPRDANPDYRKEIIVINLMNPDDEHVVRIRANSIDLEGSSLHSLFYRLVVPQPFTGDASGEIRSERKREHVLDFGTVSVGSPVVKIFHLVNVTESLLKFDFLITHKCMHLYEEVLSDEQASLSLSRNQSNSSDMTDSLVSRLLFEGSDISSDAKDQVKYFEECQNSLSDAIISKELVPLSNLALRGYQKCRIFVVFKPSPGMCHPDPFSGRPKHTSLSIGIRLSVEQDSKAVWGSETLLHVKANVCKSAMKLEQRHLNFGSFMQLPRLSKSLLLRNTSVVPLLFRIETSGSIASSDIQLSKAYGVVPPLGQLEIPFLFNATLAGKFLEKLSIRNLRDSSNDQFVTLKANVTKPVNFWIKSMELEFGKCLINHESKPQRVFIRNISSRKRSFKLKADGTSTSFFCIPTLIFRLGPLFFAAETKISITEREEEKEKLERKLRIATRKGKAEKVTALKKKLENLQNDSSQDLDRLEPSVETESGQEMTMRFQNQVVFSLEPNAVQSIVVQLIPRHPETLETSRNFHEFFQGTILVYEQNNKEYIRKIAYGARIESKKVRD